MNNNRYDRIGIKQDAVNICHICHVSRPPGCRSDKWEHFSCEACIDFLFDEMTKHDNYKHTIDGHAKAFLRFSRLRVFYIKEYGWVYINNGGYTPCKSVLFNSIISFLSIRDELGYKRGASRSGWGHKGCEVTASKINAIIKKLRIPFSINYLDLLNNNFMVRYTDND